MTSVLLLNFGGPETLDDVRPFLFNLFSDPDIIHIKNKVLRHAIAWVIATTRQRKSRELYRQIGGGSPLRRITEAQADALQNVLASRGFPARVYMAMRSWNPTIDKAVAQMLADEVKKLTVLPLFPQYSVTTSGSCLNYFRARAAAEGLAAKAQVRYVDSWFSEPGYLEAMAERIRQAQVLFSNGDREPIHLLYSAHSIPARYVAQGDPYQRQTEATVALINQRLGSGLPFTLGYQSRVGPVKWLRPATADVLRNLGSRGIRKILMVPVSFVSDHIETLQEIDIVYRDLAAQSGIREFHRAASLNVYPKFIDALADIVERQESGVRSQE